MSNKANKPKHILLQLFLQLDPKAKQAQFLFSVTNLQKMSIIIKFSPI